MPILVQIQVVGWRNILAYKISYVRVELHIVDKIVPFVVTVAASVLESQGAMKLMLLDGLVRATDADAGWMVGGNPNVIQEDSVVAGCQVCSHKCQPMGRCRRDETGCVINIAGSTWVVGFYHVAINRDTPRLAAMLIAS